MPAGRSVCGRFGALLLCVVLTLLLLAPRGLDAAAEDGKVVRVGWYESAFNRTDETGRRTGYAYEYQQRIASYTGWTYEYVEGSWTELFSMLEKGKIDLLSDVSYTAGRAEKVRYSSSSMGTETYYLFITTTNQSITADDYSTVNGKRVGVMRNSVQAGLLRQWAEQHGVTPEIIELSTPSDENNDMLFRGDLDALVTMDGLGITRPCVPVCKIGGSDIYFAVNKNRKDLLVELNDAMDRILEEDRDYNQQLFDKYVRTYGSSAFLSPSEQEWYGSNAPIRVGYCADYLPFCAEEDGVLTGSLANYLSQVEDSIKNASVRFSPVAYHSTEAALDALRAGEVDCVFPVNLSPYEGETMGLVTSSPLIQMELYALLPQKNRSALSGQDNMTVALQDGNINYSIFLKDVFPKWKAVFYPTAEACVDALRDGEADCILVNSYRLSYANQFCKRYDFQTVPTGGTVSFSFAVRREDVPLYSILNKAVNLIPRASVEADLLAQNTPEKKVTLMDFARDNWGRAILDVVIIAGVVLALLYSRVKAGRAAKERQKLIVATERDALTGLYNPSFFYEYSNRLHRERPEAPMDALMLNIDSFHTVNAMYGRESGDTVLRMLGSVIREFLAGGPGIAGRVEADSFVLYCPHIGNYPAALDRFQKEVSRFHPGVRLRMGVMPWSKDVEPAQMIERARIACGLARKAFKPHLVVFDEEMHRRELREQRLLNDLDKALQERQLVVYYQPKYDIQCEPPRLASAEALIRWKHPELGMISPGDFIPLFERNGRVGVVDKYVWRETARQIAAWRDTYGVVIPVSVNLSRVDIFDPKLEETIETLVKANGLKRVALKLEVTESAYTEDAEKVIQVVDSLRRKGYHIEMDDFGSGYSSLNMLSTMPVDILKMDQVFVRNIGRNEKDDRLVALILEIARNLRVPVVAEGVETEAQLLMLKSLGCSYVQGYYFSKPVPPEEFKKLAFRQA